MSDLIDRQAVLDALTHKWDGMVTSVFDVVKSLPSTQPEIIHCRDCKYWNPNSMECEGIGNWFGFEGAWEENGYCYKAERKADG